MSLAKCVIEENLGALDVELTADDIEEIEVGFRAIDVQGARAADQIRAAHDIGADLGTSSKGGEGKSPPPPSSRH